MKKHQEIGAHLEVNPEVCGGRLIFKGTRVWVEVVLHYLAKGGSIDYAISNYPGITREAIVEAIQLAGKALVRVCKAAPTNGDLERPAPWDKAKKKRRLARARVQ